MLLNPLLWQLECLSCLPRLPQSYINVELICNIYLNSLVTFSAKAGSSLEMSYYNTADKRKKSGEVIDG